MILSSVLNNGPVTAIGIPIAVAVAQRVARFEPLVYIMTIPHAVALGGLLTTLGSSTNYAASDYLVEAGGRINCIAAQVRMGTAGFSTVGV